MARQYSRRTFLRQTPRAILKDYFAKKGLLGPIVELCSGQPEEHAAPSPETPPTTPPPGGGEKDVGDVFDAMGKKKGSDAISDAIENLPDAQRAQIDADFEVINELAYEHGVEAILEEVKVV